MTQTQTSRRALLIGSTNVAAATLAMSSTVLAALAQCSASDAELLALGSELETVHAAREIFEKSAPIADEDPFYELHLYERHWKLREVINQIPATTIAGLAVKGRAAQLALHYDPSNENEGDGAFRDLSSSLIDDLLRIVSTGGAHA